MQHAELMRTTFVTVDGQVFATADDGKSHTLVFTRESVNPAFFDVLRSSLILYQALFNTQTVVGQMAEIAESVDVDKLAIPLMNVAAAIDVARRVSVEGIESVIACTVAKGGATH